MKKNLAKKIVMGLLTGAVLMSSSVAWAASAADGSVYQGVEALAVGAAIAKADGSIAIGANSSTVDSSASTEGKDSIAIGRNASTGGYANQSDGLNGVAIGTSAYVHGSNNVALGYGSYAGTESNVVSVGSGGNLTGDFPETRRIINVTAGVNDNDAVNVGQLEAVKNIIGDGNVVTGDSGIGCITNGATLTDTVRNLAYAVDGNRDKLIGKTGSVEFTYTNYLKNEDDLTEAAKKLDKIVKENKDYVDNNFVKISTVGNQNIISSIITIQETNSTVPITIGAGGITVGEQSTHMDEDGFYACDNGNHTYAGANAAMSKDGKIKGAAGKFEVGTNGEIKAAAGKFKVNAYGNVTAEKVTAKEVVAENLYTKEDIDGMLGGSNASISGINQRLDKTNAKINKVGAGAAALAALHPLEYDPDDKLTFSAGMGNYAGENAAALGAFYRPNEKFMVSLGGTMGNGENMVNLGLSIGLDKPNGYAKLSKRELIQEVNAVKAENEAMKAEMAEMKAMLQAILAKK